MKKRDLIAELSQALHQDDAQAVEKLISEGVDVNAMGDRFAKATPLWLAVNAAGQEISQGWDELCGLLSDILPGVERRNPAAKRIQQIRIIDTLIKAGAEVNRACHGSLPLRGAVYRRDLEIV